MAFVISNLASPDPVTYTRNLLIISHVTVSEVLSKDPLQIE